MISKLLYGNKKFHYWQWKITKPLKFKDIWAYFYYITKSDCIQLCFIKIDISCVTRYTVVSIFYKWHINHKVLFQINLFFNWIVFTGTKINWLWETNYVENYYNWNFKRFINELYIFFNLKGVWVFISSSITIFI